MLQTAGREFRREGLSDSEVTVQDCWACLPYGIQNV